MMQNPGDETEPREEETSAASSEAEAPTEALKPITLPEDMEAEAPTELIHPDLESADSGGAEITQLPLPQSAPGASTSDGDEPELSDTSDRELVIPVARQSLAQEFWGFIVHNKAWWMTPIIIVLALMVAFILFAETSPVLPFIYTVI